MQYPIKQLNKVGLGFLVVYIFVVAITFSLSDISSGIDKLNLLKNSYEYITIPDIDLMKGQKIYVPAYSSIPLADDEKQNLSILLSIRNTDPKQSIVISRIYYCDTQGKLVKQFTKTPIKTSPMQTIDFFIPQNDEIGRSGANFFVEWVSDTVVYQPVIEALMYGKQVAGTISSKATALL